jgi:hypothetical protein
MKFKSLTLAILLSSANFYFAQQKTPEREKNIEGVVITKVKKAVEQKADRTIFDFSEQPSLNSGSLMEGVKKLPGLIVSDVAGMMYQGKMLDVFMDGRPLNINGTQLQSFLEGMPANSVERVEIITQPGAEFPATSGGAIINIITNSNAKNYLSATYSGRYSFTNYDQFRSRTNNSLLLNAKNKYFGWQLNVGETYREGFRNSIIDQIATVHTNQIQRGYFAKSAVTFDLGSDKLLLNYDLNFNNNDSQNSSQGFEGVLVSGIPIVNDYTTSDFGKTKTLRQEATVTYQKKFSDRNKKLDFSANYNRYDEDYHLNGTKYTNQSTSPNLLQSTSNQEIASLKVDFSQPLKILDEGKISVGALFEKLYFDTQYFGFTNLDYQRQTTSTYAELQAKLKKFDFILGTRAEGYDISGKTADFSTPNLMKDLIPYKEFRFFPNASIQYNFAKQIYFNLNYNKKIKLPSISSLNPNNTNYQNGNISFGGNPNLQPTIYNNFEAKISMFDYAFLSYSLSIANDQNVQIAEKDYFFANQPVVNGREVFRVKNGFINIDQMKIHNFSAGIPVPFMLFTKGLKETMSFNFNPDKINFMYIYAGYQLHEIPDFQSKGFWIFNIMTQFILPSNIKLVANYSNMTKGNYYYYYMEKPWMNSFDLTASKKFMDERLTVSLFANDIFRTNVNAVTTKYKNANIYLGNNSDSQNFGISITYKIPTKNKLAKVAPNLLDQDKKEDQNRISPMQ